MVTLVGAPAPCELCSMSASPRTTRLLWIILVRIASPQPCAKNTTSPHHEDHCGGAACCAPNLRALRVLRSEPSLYHPSRPGAVLLVKLARGVGRQFLDRRQRAKPLRFHGEDRIELAAEVF